MSSKMKLIALRQAIRTGMVSKESLLQASREGMEKRARGQVKKGNPITHESLTNEIRSDKAFLDLMAEIDITMADYDQMARELLDKLERDPKALEDPEKTEKVGRNNPCPCGSGKKYKKCCGR